MHVLASVAMPVMHVGRMRMGMPQHAVSMPMRVRLAWRIIRRVCMLVVCIVYMRMRMFGRLMDMVVLMALGDMEPNTHTHQDSGDEKPDADIFAKRDHRNHRANKWRGRKISARPRSSEITKGEDIKGKTEPISQEPGYAREQGSERQGNRSTGPNSYGDVDGSRDEPLEFDDLQRVGERNLAREIVVEAPGNARK